MSTYFETPEVLDLRDLAAKAREYLETWQDEHGDREEREEAKYALEIIGNFMGELGYASRTTYEGSIEALESYAEDEPTAIRDDYFTQYAQELAADIGAIDPKASWPLNRIDWEAAAEDLLIDYNEADLEGESYYIRAF